MSDTKLNPTFLPPNFDGDDLAIVASLAMSKLATLRELQASTEASSEAVPGVSPGLSPPSGYHQAAAVLGRFDPGHLNPLSFAASGPEPDALREGVLDRLSADSLVLRGPDANGTLTLKPSVRIETLRYLREQDLVQAALEANPRTDGDLVQDALANLLSGTPPATEEQPLDALAATYKAATWLRDAGYGDLPDLQDLALNIEMRTLLEPFEHIAGRHFRGRSDELGRLRSHVGIVKAESWGERAEGAKAWLRDKAAALVGGEPEARKPLLVVGPGGVGKSALIAKFILEHEEAHRRNRFPFGYLDFDRPEVSAEEPVTLLTETVRQLGIEYPEPEMRQRCDRVRQDWGERIARVQSAARSDPAGQERIRKATVEDFISLVHGLGAQDRPVVIVLDTFEEAQYRGPEAVEAIRRMFDDLGRRLPTLRLVIAGRSEISGWDTDLLPLDVFDEDSAIGYLENRGVRPADLARRIYRQVGGSPLSLKLAADLAESEMPAGGRLEITSRDNFFRRLSSEQIQAQLYRRVLGHIQGEHAEDLRRLAHPGLVLRRLTPELIQEVLAEPCGVQIADLKEAQALFDALAREVALVNRDPDGALRHRTDLRRLMLDLLHRDEPDKARAIHAGAVAFYEKGRNSETERAEEVYHRIWLDQDAKVIEGRWRRDIGRHLYSALQEFEGTPKASLAAHLRAEVDDATLAAARLPDWEILTAARAEKRLAAGRPEEALAQIRMRAERMPDGPLPNLEAMSLAQLGGLTEAIHLLDDALGLALAHGERKTALDRGLLLAELALATEDPGAAVTALDRLAEVETRRMARMDRIELYSKRVLLGRMAGGSDLNLDPATIDDLIGRTSDGALSRQTRAAIWAAAAPGNGQADRLGRVLSVTGLPVASESAQRALALTVTGFDATWSRGHGGSPGDVARKLGVPVKETLTQAWAELLTRAPRAQAGATLGQLLREYRPDLTPELLAGFDALLRDALLAPIRGRSAAAASPPPEPSHARTRPVDLLAVIEGLASAFVTRDALRDFLQGRLSRSLDAIAAMDHGGLYRVVGSLVRIADSQGWLQLLVTRALEARPGNAELAEAAARIGLSSLAGRDKAGAAGEGGSLPSDTHWRDKLARLETQVCRVEVQNGNLGTGFLVGADLLLTAGHVIPSGGSIASEEIACRFDYRTDQSGRAVTEGTVVRLARDWLVAVGLQAGIGSTPGFALLRLADPVGVHPVGGWEAFESIPPLRGWIGIPDPVPGVASGDCMYILHHPSAGPLELSFGSIGASSELNYFYDIFTAPGSGGAPCFSADLEPIALHLGTRQTPGDGLPAGGWGLRLDAVAGDLKTKGLDNLLRARLE